MLQRVAIDCAADPVAVRHARSFMATTLEDWRLASLVDPAVLLVSEVVTNAVLHARTPFRLELSASASALRTEVYDGSPAEPRLRPADGAATTGRGLLLLEAMASRWGWQPAGPGKMVWFELPVPGGSR